MGIVQRGMPNYKLTCTKACRIMYVELSLSFRIENDFAFFCWEIWVGFWDRENEKCCENSCESTGT